MNFSRNFVLAAVSVLGILLLTASGASLSNDTSAASLSSVAHSNPANNAEGDAQDAEQVRVDAVLRAYRRLPAPELARLGVDVAEDIRAGSPQAEQLMEAWRVRQAEIQRAIDSVAKPVKLMETISQQLSEYQAQRGRAGGAGDEAAASAISAALHNLEALVLDVDNARDFHTIGGWRVLVGLLGPEHATSVRARASWVVGTAVKNNYDFQLWVLEAAANEEEILKPATSALSSLLSIVEEPVGMGQEEEEDELHRKAWYALTAAVRGNADVQAWLIQRGQTQGRSFSTFIFDRIQTLHRHWTSKLAAVSAAEVLSTGNVVSDAAVLPPYPHQLLKLWRFALDLSEENRYFREEVYANYLALNTTVEELMSSVRLLGAEIAVNAPMRWVHSTVVAAADLLEALEQVPSASNPLFVCPLNGDQEDESSISYDEEGTEDADGVSDAPLKSLLHSDTHRALSEVSSLLQSVLRQLSRGVPEGDDVTSAAIARLRSARERLQDRTCAGVLNKHILSALDESLYRL